MELSDFTSWLKKTHDFDCYQNEIFESSLTNSFESFKKSTYNGVSLIDHYQGLNLYSEFLKHYLQHLKLVLSTIPQPDTDTSWNVGGVNLNRFSHQKEELLLQVSQLRSQYGYE